MGNTYPVPTDGEPPCLGETSPGWLWAWANPHLTMTANGAAWQEDDTPARILSIIPQSINLFDFNHQNAVRAYLQAKGYQLNEDAQHIRAQRADSQITATFDDMQRLSNLSGSVSPA